MAEKLAEEGAAENIEAASEIIVVSGFKTKKFLIRQGWQMVKLPEAFHSCANMNCQSCRERVGFMRWIRWLFVGKSFFTKT